VICNTRIRQQLLPSLPLRWGNPALETPRKLRCAHSEFIQQKQFLRLNVRSLVITIILLSDIWRMNCVQLSELYARFLTKAQRGCPARLGRFPTKLNHLAAWIFRQGQERVA